ncbi:SWR1 complex bromodomain subunit bdf1 [Phytophthora citrophthora]|uniref:SWR1 complex bromodomain subunit bdf1 n=1 Tax=Phytophthora citrophthora TaxID=4793 RepID=A0AAD9LMC6_9STRA|nr:SWR1 complex bromodomain subunit bdf1 [Phytophthora citrophthora]
MISETAHAECVRLLELLTNPRVQESWSWVFMTPVDIPGYEKVIKRPMDLGTIKKNLGVKPSRCRFKSHEKFARDVRLVFQNALVYNKDDQDVKGSVYAAAQHLLRVFETAYAKAIDNVFKADDAAKAAHREAKEEKRRSEGGEGEGGSSSSSSHHHHRSSSSHHRHRDDGEESSKHKHKHSKKDKKSKKSKKKSKDREKDREHRHSSSSNGESKKKSHRSEHESSVAVSSSVATKEAVPRSSATPPAPVSHSSTSLVKREQTSGVKMTDTEMTACLSLLMKLIKYKEGNISPAAPFLQPVDLTHFPDYRIKVPNRMHLYGVQKKLRSGSYPTIDAFAYDMRLIFSNCLVYNSDVILSKVMRNHAVTLMKLFESQFAKIGGSWSGIPERWKCHQIIHEILAHRTDGQETAQWFKYPIESYYDSPDQIPYNYYKTVTEPMDIGTVSSKLHLGEYKHTSEFVAGMKLVFDNCIRYWKPDPQGQTYCESAEMLLRVLHSRSAAFGSSASSSGVSAEKQRSTSSSSSKTKPIPTGLHASSSVTPSVPVVSATGSEHEKTKKKSSSKSSSKSLKSSKPRESGGGLPEKDICLGIMKQLRGHKMKGFRGIEIKTAGPFLTAVDTTKYPDYLTIVSEPMDFAKIERKLKSDRYGSVDEFSADVHLIFSNCHKYNSDPVEGADIRAMATNLRNYFVELCNEKLGPLDGMINGPTQTPTHSAQSTATLSSTTAVQSKSSVLTRPLDAKTRAPVAGAGSASLHKPVKKSPAPSPTKKSSSASAAGLGSNSTPVRDLKREKQLPSSTSSSRKAPEAKPAFSSKPVSQVKPEAAPIAAAASSSVNKDQTLDISNAAGLTPEEAKRLRKEMKEKRRKEKKEKKEKKKKDKEKKREKKEKRERSKFPTAVQDTGLTTQESSTTGSFASATTAAASLPPPAPVAVPVKAVPSGTPSTPAVASKRGQVEPHLGSSTKKSKKHKKSDLNSWESACDRVLNRLAKIEQVAKLHFNHPLLEVFPHLTAEYSSLISEPMDLRTLREQLHSHTLTQAEFLRKGRLIFQNAVKFNCAEDPASVQVRDMSAHLLWYFDSLCAELQIIPVPEVSGEQGRAKREQLRRERAEFVSTVPVELKAKECQKLLRVLNSQKHDKNCWPFRKPVRMLFPGLSPDYFDIIKTPMDLSTIADNLTDFEYKVHGEFIRDVRLTFENAMIYNRADKDREGWSVYSAAVHMLAVVDDLWGDVTLEVTEKTRRRELVRKERMNDPKRKRSDLSDIGDERERKSHKHHHSTVGGETGHKHHHKHHHKSSKHRDEAGSAGIGAAGNTGSAATPSKSAAPAATATSVVGTIVVGGANGARDDTNASDATATRVKLQLNIGRNMERMNKQERKAEEKRRKRARREEEMARTEKRRRTAVAATDDALREAEIRSRRKMQKLEMAEAVHLREEREHRAAEEEAERARRAQMKLNVAAWTGVLIPASSKKRTGFWAKKHVKLQIPVVFQPPAINA